jgi:hypothetical protein
MRRLAIAVSVLACAGALAGAAVAQGRGGDTVARFCSDRNDLGLSHGACVAFFTNGNTRPHDADVCKLGWVRAWTGADTEGACIAALAALKR